MGILSVEGMSGIAAEMAELDQDLPFRTFMLALDEADIDDNGRESLMRELTYLMTAFRDNQTKYYRMVYSV